MSGLWQVQSGIMLVLAVALFALELYAFIDAARQRADAYTAAGKLNKPAWMGITGACAAVGLISIGGGLNLFLLLAVVGAAVYLADVRPALQQVSGRGRNDGPYGPW